MTTKPQVYLRKEVLTREDLELIRNGYAYQYTTELDDALRHKWLIAAYTLAALIDYLDGGKIDSEGRKND